MNLLIYVHIYTESGTLPKSSITTKKERKYPAQATSNLSKSSPFFFFAVKSIIYTCSKDFRIRRDF